MPTILSVSKIGTLGSASALVGHKALKVRDNKIICKMVRQKLDNTDTCIYIYTHTYTHTPRTVDNLQ